MRECRPGVVVTPQALSESEPRREHCYKRSEYVRDGAAVDGVVGEVDSVDHVADKELNIEEDNGQAVHLIGDPKVGEGDGEERSEEDTTLLVGERERVFSWPRL